MNELTFHEKLVHAIPELEKLSEIKATENKNTNSLFMELHPRNEYGQEIVSIILCNDHITLSYDYFEKRFDFNENNHEDILNELFNILIMILSEQLISVTTYSSDINISKVSDLDKPSELKKRKRHKNFRSRSWHGTYDDDCI